MTLVMDDFLKKIPLNSIKTNELMKNYTSFKIGGIADYFIMPENINQLKYIIDICNKYDINYFVMGNGSNILISDKGFRGVIIQIYKNMNSFSVDKNTISADAGIMLSGLANIALDNKLTGFEFASGIPGTLGGAVAMNAGAYNGEIKDVIIESTVMDINGNVYTLSQHELELGYRTSIVSKQNLIVLNSKIGLSFGNYDEIKNYMLKLNIQRKTKQPLELPSAGSTFKRPKDSFAGKLIMEAGLKGFSIGEAQVSEKHCGFVVNKGNASSNDIKALIEHIQNIIKQKFDIELEPEVKFLGEF